MQGISGGNRYKVVQKTKDSAFFVIMAIITGKAPINCQLSDRYLEQTITSISHPYSVVRNIKVV